MTGLPHPDRLSLAQLVAQMIVVRASGYLFDHQIQYPDWEPNQATLRGLIQDFGVGGVILLGGSAAELAYRCQELQSWAPIPLLIAADIEEGVGQRFVGATQFPPLGALGSIAQKDLERAKELATAMGAATAQEAIALGLNWILGPVVDVNNNPQNPVINVRAFSDRPEIVAQLAMAFIAGTRPYPVLTAAKHFPGHGDTQTDSHLELPVLSHPRDRLEKLEWPPFAAAIAADVDAVMTAHLLLPALDKDVPATLSEPILTEILRQELGFEKLIVTDALVMGAIAHRYGVNEAPLLALEAGADILLMPGDPAGAIAAIVAAVETGRVSRERIQRSVERIFQAKERVFVQSPPVSLRDLHQPAAVQTAQAITQESMVQIPLEPVASGLNCIIVDNILNCPFLNRQAPALQIPPKLGHTKELIIDQRMPSPAIAHLPTPPTLIQIFSRGNPFRGSAGLNVTAREVISHYLKNRAIAGLIVYGSPYIFQELSAQLSPESPCLFSYSQDAAAQEEIFSFMSSMSFIK
ncbi:beta-glucosidase [Candidatus Synechococcus calcipolaris G9]|uniref:beta-N-acetylhexosaminidase n=1 Tax=Candidatus Synechococcus calcipolaris G9 TaxID=1497997 RepID=A0ABT6EU97_9SYNE|nr:glycoside hydrolase family 3 N-terminal domain-containing protein [Candidatus Synechococcus calcipolaris]MDG2989461.1 beta-glucosidase [Candidatus Synechococcus calcipolaris G9]